MNDHTSPAKLERYAFHWLMALLAFSAVAMFLDARPLVYVIFGHSSSAVYSLLDLSWIICGVAAAYLTYLWLQNDKKVFGGNDMKDLAAFWFMLLAGYNLGVTGLLNNNIALSINMSYAYYIVLGILCLGAGYHMWTRWKASGEQLFAVGSAVASESAAEPESEPTPAPASVENTESAPVESNETDSNSSDESAEGGESVSDESSESSETDRH